MRCVPRFDRDGRSVRQAEILDRFTVTCCCPSSAHADMAVASRGCGELADCFLPACWLRSVCVMSHCRNTARAFCMQVGRQAVLGYLVVNWGHSGPSCLVLEYELIVWVLAYQMVCVRVTSGSQTYRPKCCFEITVCCAPLLQHAFWWIVISWPANFSSLLAVLVALALQV